MMPIEQIVRAALAEIGNPDLALEELIVEVVKLAVAAEQERCLWIAYNRRAMDVWKDIQDENASDLPTHALGQ